MTINNENTIGDRCEFTQLEPTELNEAELAYIAGGLIPNAAPRIGSRARFIEVVG